MAEKEPSHFEKQMAMGYTEEVMEEITAIGEPHGLTTMETEVAILRAVATGDFSKNLANEIANVLALRKPHEPEPETAGAVVTISIDQSDAVVISSFEFPEKFANLDEQLALVEAFMRAQNASRGVGAN